MGWGLIVFSDPTFLPIARGGRGIYSFRPPALRPYQRGLGYIKFFMGTHPPCAKNFAHVERGFRYIYFCPSGVVAESIYTSFFIGTHPP